MNSIALLPVLLNFAKEALKAILNYLK